MFEKYNVKTEFDLLSEDSDSYDFFMLEAILEAGYRPRVIMVEYNANFELTEARSILPPREGEAWQRWDSSTYQGMSLLAAQYLLNRFSYSVVWANKEQVQFKQQPESPLLVLFIFMHMHVP